MQMNKNEWQRMKFMVCDDFSASMFETEADAVEALNKKIGAWIFAVEIHELPTKIIEKTINVQVVDHPEP